jgi:hypothetical protein
MGLAFGYFNGFWWFFCFKNSGFVFNETNNANNANNAVNTDNTNNEQININSQNLNILSSQDTNNTKSNTKPNGFGIWLF